MLHGIAGAGHTSGLGLLGRIRSEDREAGAIKEARIESAIEGTAGATAAVTTKVKKTRRARKRRKGASTQLKEKKKERCRQG